MRPTPLFLYSTHLQTAINRPMAKSSGWQRFRKILKRLGLNSIWGKLAIAQLIVLGVLYWTWAPVSLTLIVPASEISYWETVIQPFEAEHPNIRIRPIGLNNPQGNITVNLKQICTLAVNERSLCDIIYLDVIWVPELASRGWIQPLDDRISSIELGEFVDSEVRAGQYNGNLYRIPFRADFGMLYYREDLLQQTGHALPNTFQDLLVTAQDLQAQELVQWGYLWQPQREDLISTFVEVLHGYGGDWINPDTQTVGLDQPAAIAAIEFLSQTIDQGISPPLNTPYSNEEAFDAFQKGEAAFMRNWPYVLNTASNFELSHDSERSGDRDNHPLQSATIRRIPMKLHSGEDIGEGCKGSWGFGIARRSRHPRQAWEAIQYLTSEVVQQQLVAETSYIPSRKALLSDPVMSDAAEHAILRPKIANYADASLILQTYLTQILQGQLSPVDGMRAAATETRTLLRES